MMSPFSVTSVSSVVKKSLTTEDTEERKENKNRSTPNQKGWNGCWITVSPFDGANRIRFKGSPEFGLRNSECGFEEKILSNPQSTIANPQSADSQPRSFADRGS